MANNSVERHEDVQHDFPTWDMVPEQEKQTPKYSISVAKAVHDKWKKDKTALGHSWGSFFKELRSYGIGKQSPEKYKSFLSGSVTDTSNVLDDPQNNSREAARKGWWQIDFNANVSFIPNLRSLIRGAFSEIDFTIQADNIDIDSGATEERKMLEVYLGTHPVYGRMINDLKQTAKIPIEEPEYIPEDLKELEDLKAEGGFKEPYIQQHEKLLLHTENTSDWDRFLKDELLTDAMDLGYLFAYVDYDEERCMPKWHYADPEQVVIQYDRDNGFKNSDYAQVKEQWTISKLKQYRDCIYHADGHKITEEEFRQMAKMHCKTYGNPDEREWASFDKADTGGFAYDSFKVLMGKTWWIDVEYIKRVKYYNRYGKLRMYDYREPIEKEYDVKAGENEFDYPYDMGDNYALNVEPIGATKIAKKTKRRNGFGVVSNDGGRIKVNAKINIGKDETLHTVRLRKLYYCWWIVDTDFCIKFGAMPNQPRNRYVEPLIPLVGYRLPDKSLTFRCVPIEDIYNIAFFRFQNGLAKAMQGVYALNTTLFDTGGQKISPLAALKMMRENQFLPYKLGSVNVGGTPVPLTYIPGNLQEVITTEALIMDRCMKWVEDQTGFSLLALGATPSPDTPVGTSERSLQQTQKSLLPITTALRYIKEELGRRTSSMWQLAIQNDKKARQEASKVIGEDGVFILQQAKSLDVQYGIKLVAKPDAEMKRAVMEAATISFQNKEITSDERLFIIEQVMSGQNLRELRMKLRKMIQKNKQMEEMYKQQAIALQNKGLQETAMKQAESAERIKQSEAKAKDAEIRTQAQADIVIRHHDSDMKIKEEIAKKQLEMGQMPSVGGQQGQPAPMQNPPQNAPQNPVQNP